MNIEMFAKKYSEELQKKMLYELDFFEEGYDNFCVVWDFENKAYERWGRGVSYVERLNSLNRDLMKKWNIRKVVACPYYMLLYGNKGGMLRIDRVTVKNEELPTLR